MRRVIGRQDGVILVGVAATLLAAVLSYSVAVTGRDLLGYALVVGSALVLLAGRWFPLIVLAMTGLCGLAYQALGLDVPVVAFLFAVYASVRAGHRIVTIIVAVIMLVTLPFAILLAPSSLSLSEALIGSRDALPFAWLVAAGAAGEALRQAERRADEAERTREETARRRADEERLHIARELHDTLTHQISVIKVQADVAVHLAGRRGERVPDALLAIQEAGREAARELRATLSALRDDDRFPPQGLDAIPELVQRSRATGLDVTLTVDGEPDNVPAAVDRTAYRVVQEALTNTARHAAATTATVRIGYRPDTLVIRVDDDGTATRHDAPSAGVGLLGMRERITALGGRLRAAPRAEGGFTVHAELPVRGSG